MSNTDWMDAAAEEIEHDPGEPDVTGDYTSGFIRGVIEKHFMRQTCAGCKRFSVVPSPSKVRGFCNSGWSCEEVPVDGSGFCHRFTPAVRVE